MSDRRGVGRRVRIAGSAVATGKGDDGTTGLLYGGRITKDDARAEAYGTIDEAVACLGVARAELGALAARGPLPGALAGLEGHHPAAAARPVRGRRRAGHQPGCLGSPARWRDTRRRGHAERARGHPPRPPRRPWTCPASSSCPAPAGSRPPSRSVAPSCAAPSGASSRLDHDRLVPGAWLMPYLNRLADLLWVLARLAEQAEGLSCDPLARRDPERPGWRLEAVRRPSLPGSLDCQARRLTTGRP